MLEFIINEQLYRSYPFFHIAFDMFLSIFLGEVIQVSLSGSVQRKNRQLGYLIQPVNGTHRCRTINLWRGAPIGVNYLMVFVNNYLIVVIVF